jgi:hypothetical protein
MTLLSPLETQAAYVATRVIRKAGGELAAADYEAAMACEAYRPPVDWLVDARVMSRTAQIDHRAARAAIDVGLIEATDEGYRVT